MGEKKYPSIDDNREIKDNNSHSSMQFLHLRFRYHTMRLFSVLILSFFISNLSAQETTGCKNEVNIKALIKGLSPGDSIISYKALTNADEIVPEFNRYEILSFTATLFHLDEPVEFSVTGSKFSENNRKLLSRLRPGDQVYFSNIRAMFGDGPTLCLKSAYYRIAE